jgi:pimeloyl-ACP methyl ester carboxylesterase
VSRGAPVESDESKSPASTFYVMKQPRRGCMRGNAMPWRYRLPMVLVCCLAVPVAWGATGASYRTVEIAGGGSVRVEAGVLRVPESRAHATRRRIGIPWYRLASTAEHPAAPIFMLAGGPGASGLDGLQSAEVYREVAFYRSMADVVLFDQRGAGHAKPLMRCPQTARYPYDQPLDWARLRKTMRRMLAACRDHWQRQGVDLAAYNTVENAADVDDLRRALGYGKVTLVGGSYGSHLALQVMRRYPQAVDRAVLYGIEGPDQTWDDPDEVLAALRRHDEALQAQAPRLGLRVPKGGWLAALGRVERRLGRQPVDVALEHGGRTTHVVVDAGLVRLMALHRAGGHDDRHAWANMILAMDQGDFSQAARAAIDFRDLRLSRPMHYSMDCASGVDDARRARYARSSALGLIGDINLEYRMLCDLWPTRDPGPGYRATVVSSIPALLFQGTWDVSTPLENAHEVLAGLRRGQLVTVVGGNHGALYNLYDHWPPMHALMRGFLTGHDVRAPAQVVMPWAGAAVSP